LIQLSNENGGQKGKKGKEADELLSEGSSEADKVHKKGQKRRGPSPSKKVSFGKSPELAKNLGRRF